MQNEYFEYKSSFGQRVPFDSNMGKFQEKIQHCGSIYPGETAHEEDLMVVMVYPDTTSFDRIHRDTRNTRETQLALIGGTMGLLTGKYSF